ncbi:hypothetical protein PPK14_gp38 [Bacillus phage vB_BspS_SplendidRed]|uniref:Uncharacterized protein n=1 Tax=Bacillus phage vB_BspS_SplendidRed TaxID=2591379 RepID=A0A5B9NL79_9CAUD|nr:hypothetical protein PPK14_gp38 [Bacillus phage vB_BspS_SplendidRed]QEG13512.1 hypothetical protein SPLENDIDRED_38 [Bacillus phage vB_BspS_SplendidRed]
MQGAKAHFDLLTVGLLPRVGGSTYITRTKHFKRHIEVQPYLHLSFIGLK